MAHGSHKDRHAKAHSKPGWHHNGKPSREREKNRKGQRASTKKLRAQPSGHFGIVR